MIGQPGWLRAATEPHQRDIGADHNELAIDRVANGGY